MDLTQRPRRLRRDGIRDLVAETSLEASDLIAPVFVDATADERVPIESMPGHERVPVTEAVARVEEVAETGVEAVLLFGVPESKDPEGSRAWADDGVIQRALRRITDATDAVAMTDVCLCEYTEHGHCGVLEPGARARETGGDGDPRGDDPDADAPHGDPGGDTDAPAAVEPVHRRTGTVDNDATLDLIERVARSHAEAGADVVAPSGAIDGMVGAIRAGLDDAGFSGVPIMSYAAKYESAFYGPFRDAADGAPAFGDRRHYQMNPANAREARREVALDADQGADVLMVKPALPYLDVVRQVGASADRPVAAYNVSGEYAMLHAAADRGWLDLDAAALESLLGIKRAGADLIVTYFAERVAERL